MIERRHTADTITDDALDALYESLEAAQQTALARQLATCDQAFASATHRAAVAEQRAVRAEVAIVRVREALDDLCEEPHPSHDHVCPDDVRRRILAALDEPKEPRP
jgi:hypothetical protein